MGARQRISPEVGGNSVRTFLSYPELMHDDHEAHEAIRGQSAAPQVRLSVLASGEGTQGMPQTRS